MLGTTFTVLVLLIIGKVVFDDANDRIWRLLSKAFPTEPRRNDWSTAGSLYAWDDSARRKHWYNAVHITFESTGLRLDPTWMNQWYKRSIQIPWSKLERDDEPQKRGALLLRVRNGSVRLRIPKRHVDRSIVDAFLPRSAGSEN